MPHLLRLKIFKFVFSTALLLMLCACGGNTGFPPVVTAFKVQTLQYGRLASFVIGGNDLRSTMTVDTGGACTSPTLTPASGTSLVYLSCTVAKLGEMPLTIKDGNGNVLYQTTLTVPKPQVSLVTSSGTITLELDPAAAPVTVGNFLNYVHNGYYTNTLFHRVIAGFVIQGGGYTAGRVKKPGQTAPIAIESNNGLSNLRGTIAMARTSDPNSATSEFFINVVNNTVLDYQNAASPGYAVFGTVLQGLDVMDAIAAQPTGLVNGFADVPLTDVTITSATQIK
jgi:cyclophilin family peptidyl-prolyl cis-trans isomerase